ncbi:MAG: hypothetical protein AAF125_19380, partial [Chloroflexota bacterium]
FVAGGFVVTSTVLRVEDWDRARYTIPPLIGLIGLWAALGAGAIITLSDYVPRAKWLGGSVALTLMILPTVVFSIRTHQGFVADFAPTHIIERVWRWTDASLEPPEGKIMIIRGQQGWQQLVWDRTYGGYNGHVSFEFVVDPDPAHQSPSGFVEDGVTYLFLSALDLEEEPSLVGYTDQLLHLKTFGAHHPAASNTHFYRMLRPQVESDFVFQNDIRMIGYDLSLDGDQLRFRPYWQAAQPVTQNLSMYVHLRPTNQPDAVLVQSDGPPGKPNRLTPSWDDPNETLIGRDVQLALPDEPSDLTLWVGLYDPETGEVIEAFEGEGTAPGVQIPLTSARATIPHTDDLAVVAAD